MSNTSYEARLEALNQAIRISPNNERGDAKQVVADAERFLSFLTGNEPQVVMNFGTATTSRLAEELALRARTI